MDRREIGGRLDVFLKRKRVYAVALIAVVLLYAGASLVTGYQPADGVTSIPRAFEWIAKNLVPNQKAMDRLPRILDKLSETALLSVASTVIAAVCAFFFSLLGSNATGINGGLSWFVRMFAAFFRNVPDVVWAMLLMFSFGQNILIGFFALFFTTFGMLTRTFIETIDEVSADCIEALRASGANYLQTVFQAVVPSSISEIITWILFMIETNIRSSTLIGILTATGIGYLFDLYYKRLDYASGSLVVLSIVLLVLLIELITAKIRKVIL